MKSHSEKGKLQIGWLNATGNIDGAETGRVADCFVKPLWTARSERTVY